MVQMKYLVPPELHLSSNKLAVQKEQEKAENDWLWWSVQWSAFVWHVPSPELHPRHSK